MTALKSVDFPTLGNPTIPALSIGAQVNARCRASQCERTVGIGGKIERKRKRKKKTKSKLRHQLFLFRFLCSLLVNNIGLAGFEPTTS